MLVLVTFFWGLSFPLIKIWQDTAMARLDEPLLASLTLVAVRYLAGWALMVLCFPRVLLRATAAEQFAGTILGATYFAASTLQVIGLAWTTPAMSAFLTSLGSLWVPVLDWLWRGKRATREVWSGLVLGLAGTVVLAQPWAGWNRVADVFGTGELLTVMASVLFAVQILQLDHYGQRLRPSYFTSGLLLTTAASAWILTVALVHWSTGWGEWLDTVGHAMLRLETVVCLALLVVFPTVSAFHLMNVYQPLLPPARAALIYLLEPVFASVLSAGLGLERLTVPLLLGGALILSGNVVAEWPRFRQAAHCTTDASCD